MLERLAAKLLQRVLSQYFEQREKKKDKTSTNGPTTPTKNSTNSTSSSLSSSVTAVWSGFVQYEHLYLKVDRINAKLAGDGHPFRVQLGFIRNLTITVPWGKLASGSGRVVMVVDGLFLLASLELESFDDVALRKREIEKRRQQLREGTQKLASSSSATAAEEDLIKFCWKDYLKRKLQEGLLPALADRIEIHIRDFHLRIENYNEQSSTTSASTNTEDASLSNSFALGVVLESMHIQKDAQKFSQLNHLGVYLNHGLEIIHPTTTADIPINTEHCLLRAWKDYANSTNSEQQEEDIIIASMDKMIARRISTQQEVSSFRAPAHTYLLMPVDGTLQASFFNNASTTKTTATPPSPQQQQRDNNSSQSEISETTMTFTSSETSGHPPPALPPSPPMVGLVWNMPHLTLQLRDIQVLQLLELYYDINTHKYRRQYYRPHRPFRCGAVKDNPRAWWHYAFAVVCLELRKHRKPVFTARFRQRNRYCDLYHRKLVGRYDPDQQQEDEETATTANGTAAIATTTTTTSTDYAADDAAGLPCATTSVNTDGGPPPLTSTSVTTTTATTTTRSTSTTTSLENQQLPPLPRSSSSLSLLPLSLLEEQELRNLEDGVEGDLTVQDILLFRIIVHKRIGGTPSGGGFKNSALQQQEEQTTSSSSSTTTSVVRSWFRRYLVTKPTRIRDDEDYDDDDTNTNTEEEEEETAEQLQDYQHLVADWQDWTEKQAKANQIAANTPEGLSPVAIAVQLNVDMGRVAFYAPLIGSSSSSMSAAADHTKASLLRLLQQKFLDLTFTQFQVDFSLMRDFDSFAVQVSLLDYVASEMRGFDQKTYTVVTRASTSTTDTSATGETCTAVAATDYEDAAAMSPPLPPVVELVFTKKNPKDANDFHIGLKARVRALQIVLRHDSEWIVKMKALIRPLPQFEKATKFWKELNMASINTWMSDQLGVLVVKANTVVAEHKNMNLHIQVDCPILRISDGQGNAFVVNLGRAQFRTERLAGVADALLLRGVMPPLTLSVTGNNNKHNALAPASASPNDVGSQPEPASSWPSPSTQHRGRRKRDSCYSAFSRAGDRSVYGGLFTSSADSVDFGASIRFDESMTAGEIMGGYGGGGDAADSRDTDLLFYDVFEFRLEPGGIFIESSLSSGEKVADQSQQKQQIVEPMDITVFIHKSVLPADHTLCRYKIRCKVPEITFNLSEQSIILVADLLSKWSLILSSNAVLSQMMPVTGNLQQKPILSEVVRLAADTETDTSDSGSSFDENEFFDAVESDVYTPDQHFRSLLEETWMADSESVVDSEVRSVLGSGAPRSHRRRQMSDASSISDSSAKKKRSSNFHENYYLSAEYLARLEEEAVGEDSVGEAKLDSEDGSFHSAVSIRHVEAVEQELSDDIQKHEKHISKLRNQISDLRHNQGGGVVDPSIAASRDKVKKELRLELQRAEAELKTLRATLSDLVAEKASLDKDNRRTLVSLRRASCILQSRRHSGRACFVSGLEHTLTKDLKRESLQISLSVSQLRFRFTCASSRNGRSSLGEPVFVASLFHFGAVLRQRAGESRIFTCIENLQGSFLEGGLVESRQLSCLNGGVNYELAGNVLASRFPHLISSATMEEKLLRCAIEVKKGSVVNGRQVKLIKLRLVLGDFEATAHPSMLASLKETTDSLKGCLKKSERSVECAKEVKTQTSPCYEVGIRLTAVRCILCDGDVFAALALTEVGFRFARAPQMFHNDRSQLDSTLGNIQLIWIHDFDAGQAVELLGKRDLHPPIARLRFRHQEVSRSETKGWVTGCPPTVMNGYTAIESFVSNVHLGLKFDGLCMVVIPGSVVSIGRPLKRLKDSWSCPTSTPTELKPSGEEPPHRQEIRWRIDFVLKKSFVTFQAEAEPQDAFHIGESLQQKLVASFAASGILQPTETSSEAFILQGKVHDYSLTRVPGNISIIEPAFLYVNINAPLSSRYPKSSCYPQLTVSDESNWAVPLQFISSKGPEPETIATEGCLVAVYSSISDVRVRLTPSSLVLLLDLISVLSRSKTSPQLSVLKTTDHGQGTAGTKQERSLWAHVDLDGISFSLAKESAASLDIGRPSENIATFRVEGVRLAASKSGSTTSCTAVVSYGSVTDFTYRSGVQSLSGGCQFGSSPGSAFIHLKCQLAKVCERSHLDFKLHLGNIKFLPLPSCIRSILQFIHESRKELAAKGVVETSDAVAHGAPTSGKILGLSTVALVIQSGLIECILSSRDIPRYLLESSLQAIGVVAFRLKLEAKGLLRITSLDEASSPEDIVFFGSKMSTAVDSAMMQYLIKRASGPSTGFSSEMDVRISDLQVLRTTITKSETCPISFSVTPPLIGEQRITNAFDFSVTHRAACSSFPHPAHALGPPTAFTTSAAHSIQLQAGFVDVLLYISRSAGGMNEALRTSVIPIIDLFKKSKDDRQSKENPDVNATLSLKEKLLSAPLACSIQMEGLTVTCVPGGATRLTESPIVKFSVLDLKGGFAMVPISSDWKIVPSMGTEESSTASGVNVKHIVAGGWIIVDLSASYHNRRLVEWEPFIEPWKLELLLGIDLSRTVKVGPLLEDATAVWSRREERIQPQRSNPLDIGGARLRDIGRLLRSPFQSDSTAGQASEFELTDLLYSDVDFCYLALMSTASETLALAAFPREATGLSVYSVSRSFLPHDRPIRWLNQFGYPTDADPNPTDLINHPSIMCRLADSAPLNINITGALIENVSDYLGVHKYVDSRRLAPHWIRNDSGLTLRFQELLDAERRAKGEKASKVTMASDTEVPLSLKRSLSQSCDPHMAYISIELGSFEDTIGRVSTNGLGARKGTRSSAFSYRVKKRIPVDAVGLRRYPVDWNTESREHPGSLPETGSLGWIIVRVALNGGIKMVTIESPLFLKNNCDTDLLCEVRDHDGLSLLWRSLVPKVRLEGGGFVPVPADVVPILHSEACLFSAIALPRESSYRHESELVPCDRNLFTRLHPPRPYARTSLAKGVIQQRNKTLMQFSPTDSGIDPASKVEHVNINLCSVRIGSIALEQTRAMGIASNDQDVPEQRMLIFRSILSVANHLAFPLRVQVRVKETPSPGPRGEWLRTMWFDLGVLDCGQVVSWTGAAAVDKIELRARFEGSDGTSGREFPSWSTTTTIPPEEASSSHTHTPTKTDFSRLTDLKLLDASDTPLLLSVALGKGTVPADLASSCSSVKSFSKDVPQASRVVGLFAPFWVIDDTGLNLQYKSGTFLSGHVELGQSVKGVSQHPTLGVSSTLGLGELLDDINLTYLPSRQSFEVFMVGNEGSNWLQVRRRLSLVHNSNSNMSPWSDPIPLSSSDGSYHDTTVLPPQASVGQSMDESTRPQEELDTFALRSRLFRAPPSYGGHYGTRLVHVVCRYAIVNDLGREIEVSGVQSESRPIVAIPNSRPTPFHFDDTGSIRFRPKEYGWAWSGRFHVRRNRKELTFCLTHKIKGSKILVTVEVHSKQKAGTCLVVFRHAPHAPYRLENRTVYAIQYRQVSSLFDVDAIPRNLNSAPGPVVLPYHDVEFAWEEPESGRHSIAVHLADFGDHPTEMTNQFIGTVRVDRIAPGSTFRFRSAKFSGQAFSDGPTLVLRITETVRTEPVRRRSDQVEEFTVDEGLASVLTWMVTVKFVHGIGISLVDWTPQELVYLRLEDIFVEKVHGGTERTMTAAIGRVVVNNQLWVTPYPVLMRVGSRSKKRRHRRHSAVALSWRRKTASGTGYGNMTMFEFVELSIEPVAVGVDGNLTKFLIAMLRRVKDVGSVTGRKNNGLVPRDQMLSQVLRVEQPPSTQSAKADDRKSTNVDDLYFAVDRMATSAIASKLRSSYRAPSQLSVSRHNMQLRPNQKDAVSRRPHKYYMEKLRISTITADISWSGALPIASSLPGLLRPSFTFEGLPVLLRPLSSSHAYGTTDDHIQNLRSHYISIWRILDLLVGVLAKPSFLARAVIFTGRESLGSAFDAVSTGLQSTESLMLKLVSVIDSKPTWAFAGPFVKFNLALVHGLAAFSIAGSRILHYHSARHRASSLLLRSRNPRLFANVNGKDLLVEYVEGENAGKAFLSRVATGMHLGEGYNFHAEGIRLSRSRSTRGYKTDPSTYVLMMTFERVLLLSGRLDASFCDIVWEADFSDVVYVETRESQIEQSSDDDSFVVLQWWFLQGSSLGSREERLARAFVNDAGGLAALGCRKMFVPADRAELVLSRIKLTNPGWIELPMKQEEDYAQAPKTLFPSQN